MNCIEPNCKSPTRVRGLCNKHYLRGRSEYSGVHHWLSYYHSHLKEKCLKCGSLDNLEFANITGVHEKDTRNYTILCRGCHAIMDKKKTHCIRGHEFSDSNIRYYKGGKGRGCVTCHKITGAEYRKKHFRPHPHVKVIFCPRGHDKRITGTKKDDCRECNKIRLKEYKVRQKAKV